jgi:hypothetical protein
MTDISTLPAPFLPASAILLPAIVEQVAPRAIERAVAYARKVCEAALGGVLGSARGVPSGQES